MPDKQSIYEVLIRFGLDDKQAKNASREITNLQSQSQKGASSLKGMEGALKGVVQQGLQLAGIGSIIGVMVKATQAYNTQVGAAENTSRGWMTALQGVESGWVNVGRAIEQNLLPELTTASQLMQLVTNPEGFKALAEALVPGRGGAAATFTGKEQDNFERARKQNPLLGTAYEAGSFIYKLITGQPSPGGQGGGQGGTMGAAAGAGERPNGAAWDLASTVRQAYQYQQQTLAIQRAANIQLRKMTEDFNKSELRSHQDYQKTVARSNRDFNLQQTYQLADFNRQRAIQIRDFGIQLVRSEQDYQRQRARAAQDHQFDLFQIVMSGDAMQYYLSERSYKLQQSRAEEDYNIQRGRSQEDFARQQQDAETEFAITRARSRYEHQVMLSDQEQDFNIQRARAAEDRKIELARFQESLNEQKLAREQAARDQIMLARSDADTLVGLRAKIGSEEINTMNSVYNTALNWYSYLSALPAPPSGQPGTPHQAGGYTKPWYEGRNEFILDGSTTDAAEKAAKTNHLTQADIVGLFSGGQKQGLTYNDHRQFVGPITEEDRALIAKDTVQTVKELLGIS